MEEDTSDLVPEATPKETALDIAAFVTSAVPWIGGPVSAVLSGMSIGRKFARVREVLEGLTSELKDFKSKVSEEYVHAEEFEELLEQTLRRVADERSEEKRKIYRDFLTDTIKSPGESYDEQIHFLRDLERLQPDHIRVLRALSQSPNPNPGIMGSPNQTLISRLPDIDKSRIEDLVTQLNDYRITKLTSLKVMMTAHGAEDLRNSITSYGQRFMRYILKT